MPPGWHEGRDHDEGPSKPLEVWGYADLVLDLTPGTGLGGLIRETPRLEAVLGKTHRTEFERGRRKRGLGRTEEPAAQPKGCMSVTLHLRLRAPVLYSTVNLTGPAVRSHTHSTHAPTPTRVALGTIGRGDRAPADDAVYWHPAPTCPSPRA